MGTEIGRIEKEYILRALEDGNIPIDIRSNKKTATVIILENKFDSYVEVYSKDREFANFVKNDRLNCYFSYLGNVMTFYSKILSCNEEKARIAYPKLCLRNLQRKNVRVEPAEGLELKFKIKDFTVELNYPKTDSYFPVEDFSKIDKMNNAGLKELIVNFQKMLLKKCEYSNIVLFNNRKLETLEERIVAKGEGIFYIPSIYEAREKPEVSAQIPIINNEEIAEGEMHLVVLNMKKKGLYSVIYCPIFYHEYLIGYIYLQNKSNKKISTETIEYVYQFTKILVWLFVRNNYFKEAKKKTEIIYPQIINISESGVLFAYQSQRLKEFLKIYTDLPIELIVNDKTIVINSRVMRKFVSEKDIFYGMKFIDFPPEYFEHLFEFIYGRKIIEKDKLWEGGAKPPVLEK